ncbi:MAG: hypothetical protein A2V66_03610 [Ignavibacteria bacterium RBG_13_36_8]|nr:MAG: hypothetical protein A2V66_03610 [Ignavibacteria bacterium RBG_13_36_8]
MIYEPKGRAREYSPLAVSLYKGCDHGCEYCCIKKMKERFAHKYVHTHVEPKKDALKRLMTSAKKFAGTDKQVLMSFGTDPYNGRDTDLKLTREALIILHNYKIPVAILTKGGSRVMRDADIFKKFGDSIKVGVTLTFIDEQMSKRWEPYAASPTGRIVSLKYLHEMGIRTWVSLEPVIDTDETLKLIDLTHEFVDEYRVGKLNYCVIDKKINWVIFAHDVVNKLSEFDKEFYIKEDLRKFVTDYLFYREETDMDYLNVPKFQ